MNGRVQAQIEELAGKSRSPDGSGAVARRAPRGRARGDPIWRERVKIPGFRKGKVPRQVLVQKVGSERLMTEAVESHIGGWFWNAAARRACARSHSPSTTSSCPTSDDEDWQFTATFPVQAKPELPDWTTLEVGAIEPEVPEELVQQELDALRSTVAELVPVEGRAVGPERHRRSST